MKIVNLMLLSLLCGVIVLPSVDVNAGIFGKNGGRSQGMSNSIPEGQTIEGVAGGAVRKLSPIPPKIKSALFGAVFSCAQLRV